MGELAAEKHVQYILSAERVFLICVCIYIYIYWVSGINLLSFITKNSVYFIL